MDPSSMYHQHHWASTTWGLLLLAMVLLVGTSVLVAFAVMMRMDSHSDAPSPPTQQPPA